MSWTARREGLVVTEVGDDLVVYDERSSHLHTVPAAIAAVWRSCDGVATREQIASTVGLSSPQVEAALLQLRQANLMEGESPRDVPTQGRRRFLKQAALGVAIVSVTAPMAASASSVAPGPVVPAGQCWYQNPGNDNVWQEESFDYETCRLLDGCHEGENESSGGCYKWTVGQNEPHGGWIWP